MWGSDFFASGGGLTCLRRWLVDTNEAGWFWLKGGRGRERGRAERALLWVMTGEGIPTEGAGEARWVSSLSRKVSKLNEDMSWEKGIQRKRKSVISMLVLRGFDYKYFSFFFEKWKSWLVFMLARYALWLADLVEYQSRFKPIKFIIQNPNTLLNAAQIEMKGGLVYTAGLWRKRGRELITLFEGERWSRLYIRGKKSLGTEHRLVL